MKQQRFICLEHIQSCFTILFGLIGEGYDEDGTAGYMNPMMTGRCFQKNGFTKPAISLMIHYLQDNLNVKRININHRKENVAAGKIYESFGFVVYNENNNEFQRKLNL